MNKFLFTHSTWIVETIDEIVKETKRKKKKRVTGGGQITMTMMSKTGQTSFPDRASAPQTILWALPPALSCQLPTRVRMAKSAWWRATSPRQAPLLVTPPKSAPSLSLTIGKIKRMDTLFRQQVS